MNNKQLEYEYGITSDKNGICEVCHFEAKVSSYDIGYSLSSQIPRWHIRDFKEVCAPCMLEIARYLKSKFKTGE